MELGAGARRELPAARCRVTLAALSMESMRVLALVLSLLVGTYTSAADQASIERQKIDYLISSVETLQGARFIRNDKSYNAHAAADHLRLKLRMAGSRIVTADDFIRLCASVSSISGLPYQIRFADGQVVSAESFLRQKLVDFAHEDQEQPESPQLR
jgi:hypothetical protein